MPRSRGNGGVVGKVITPGTSGVVTSQDATQYVLSGEWPGSTYAAATVSSNAPTVTSIVVTDSGYNNVSSNISYAGSYIKIFGINFQSNSSVVVQNTTISSANVSYVNSSELRVILPRLYTTGTNLNLSVTNPINYSSSTFIDSPVPIPNVINYLVVAGGAAGGGHCGGGGGAGGLLYSNTSTITSNSYTVSVTIGAGASASGGYGAPRGGNGSNSELIVDGNTTQTITSTGGGGGGTRYTQNSYSQGAAGGSGGGGSNEADGTSGSGIAGQGNRGGNGHESDGRSGGGGGGAGSEGVGGASYVAGNGGSGLQLAINGTNTYYSSGGGGGLFADPPTGVAGSAGTGGSGNGGANAVGSNGTANRGHGGGGGVGGGGAGGSGIVIVRWPTSFSDVTSSTGSPSKTTADGHTIYTFNSSGTLTFTAA